MLIAIRMSVILLDVMPGQKDSRNFFVVVTCRPKKDRKIILRSFVKTLASMFRLF